MRDYTTVDTLSAVYLEDSWVLGIVDDTDTRQLRFRLEVVLTPKHPAYHPPKPGEQYCYAQGWLIFSDARVVWLQKSDSYAIDATGEKDHGNIDSLTRVHDHWHAEGSWGEVHIYTDADPSLALDAPESTSEQVWGGPRS